MSDMAMIRIGILIAGLLLVAAIFLFGRPKKSPQGRRVDKDDGQPRERREPVISSEPGVDGDPFERNEGAEQSELNLDGADAAGGNDVGKRPNQDFDKIVSLFVAAKAGQVLRGEDVVVAAEKTGLVFGHMNVFHRLVEGAGAGRSSAWPASSSPAASTWPTSARCRPRRLRSSSPCRRR